MFTVPRSITSSLSQGLIFLIAKSAKMVTAEKNILEDFQFLILQEPKKFPDCLNRDENKIVILLQDQNLNFNELVKE